MLLTRNSSSVALTQTKNRSTSGASHVRQRRRSERNTSARTTRGVSAFSCRQADQAGRQDAHAIGRGRCRLRRRFRIQGCLFYRRSPSSGQRSRRSSGCAASCSGSDQRDEGRRDPDLFHICGQRSRFGEASFGQEDHLLRHGPDPAHHAGASYGRAIESVCLGGILCRATRRDPSGPRATENYLGRGRDRARACSCHGAWRRGPRGCCHRAPSRRRRRGL